LTENSSPSGHAEFQIEATGNRLAGSALIEGFVHPGLLKVTFNLGSSAIAKVLTSSAFSTVDSLVRAVGEPESERTPDGTINDLLLVARSNLSQLAELRAPDSFTV